MKYSTPNTVLNTTIKTAIKTAIKTTIGTAVLCAATSSMAQSRYDDMAGELKDERSKRETTHVLGGAVIGGILAGPPGAMGMAILGAFISDDVSNENEKEAALASLEMVEQDYLALLEEREVMQLALQELQNARLVATSYESTSNTSAACCENTELVLHFRTASSDIESHYMDELIGFASFVKNNPDTVVQITGYADQRGTSTENLSLSQSRINVVKNTLENLGLKDMSMQSVAYGESRPLVNDENPDALFFDRRVVLSVKPAGNEYLTQIPE